MLRRKLKIIILISLASVIILLPAIGNSAAVLCPGKDVKHTAKITFFKNRSGNLMAEIIPLSAEGYSPRCGWTICEIMASDIRNLYTAKTKDLKRIKGYFVATYRIIEKDKESIFPMYKGELLKIEPWFPEFINN